MRRNSLILQRGTTGFQHYKETQLPVVDLREFRSVFHAVVCDASANVIHNPRRNPEVECNFADALVELGGDRIAVLLNCFQPLVAFAAESELNSPPEFCDNTALALAFSAYPDFTVLSLDTLNQMPTPEMLAGLAPAEIEQFDYWKPTRLGDVIFNYWD